MILLNISIQLFNLYNYLDRENSMISRVPLIDRKYPVGLSAGKFARYGRSPVNWHARRIAPVERAPFPLRNSFRGRR